MTRLRSTLATGAAAAVLALTAMPGTATAQNNQGVDENTGPVAYANAAGIQVKRSDLASGKDPGTVVTETQRSPLRPGQSQLDQARTLVPNSDKERESVGAHYNLYFGKPNGIQPFEKGGVAEPHNIVASLRDTHVPAAMAESNFALLYTPGGTALNLLEFKKAKATVECGATDKTSSDATAEKLWVLNQAGTGTEEVTVPATGKVERTGLKFGAPIPVEGASALTTTSDISISKLSSFAALLKQKEWRGGDVNAASGWQIDIVTHPKNAAGQAIKDRNNNDLNISTKIVLAGVSCSLPKGFKAIQPGSQGGGGQVPVKIPAGPAAAAPAPVDNGTDPVGYALIGGGLLLTGGAFALMRRRRAVAKVPVTRDTE